MTIEHHQPTHAWAIVRTDHYEYGAYCDGVWIGDIDAIEARLVAKAHEESAKLDDAYWPHKSVRICERDGDDEASVSLNTGEVSGHRWTAYRCALTVR